MLAKQFVKLSSHDLTTFLLQDVQLARRIRGERA